MCFSVAKSSSLKRRRAILDNNFLIMFKYTGTDVYTGDITDFDLPAQYNTQYQQYITPELVYANPSGINQFLPTDPIWQTQPYQYWFNNQGLSITGVNDYPITILSSYLALNSTSMVVDNVYGFPTTGVVLIGTEEIAYSSVDRAYGTLSGLTRGVNGTTITNHIPGEQIIRETLLQEAEVATSQTGKVQGQIKSELFKKLGVADFDPGKFSTTINLVKQNKPLNTAANKILADVMVAMIKTSDDNLLNQIFTNLKQIEAK